MMIVGVILIIIVCMTLAIKFDVRTATARDLNQTNERLDNMVEQLNRIEAILQGK